MDHEKALSILQALSGGTDPFTGEPFPAASIYQHPDVVRALFQAVRALEAAVAVQKRHASRPAAGNSGKPWSLITGHFTGTPNGGYAQAVHDHIANLQ